MQNAASDPFSEEEPEEEEEKLDINSDTVEITPEEICTRAPDTACKDIDQCSDEGLSHPFKKNLLNFWHSFAMLVTHFWEKFVKLFTHFCDVLHTLLRKIY